MSAARRSGLTKEFHRFGPSKAARFSADFSVTAVADDCALRNAAVNLNSERCTMDIIKIAVEIPNYWDGSYAMSISMTLSGDFEFFWSWRCFSSARRFAAGVCAA